MFSPAYVGSTYTQSEWAAAFNLDPNGERGILVPVRVATGTPEGLLRQVVYIDLVGRNEAQARKALLSGVKRTRAELLRSVRLAGDTLAPT